MMLARYTFESPDALKLNMEVTISMTVKEWRELEGLLRESYDQVRSEPLREMWLMVANIVKAQRAAFTASMESGAYYTDTK